MDAQTELLLRNLVDEFYSAKHEVIIARERLEVAEEQIENIGHLIADLGKLLGVDPYEVKEF